MKPLGQAPAQQGRDTKEATDQPGTRKTWLRPGRFSGFGLDGQTAFLLAVVILLAVVLSAAMPTMFPTWTTVDSMAFQASEVGILTVAMALSILIGGIDLSVNAVANLSAITAGLILHSQITADSPTQQVVLVMAIAFAAALAVGTVCGWANGMLIGRVGVPAILATIATLTLYTGFAFGVTGGRSISKYPDEVLSVGIGKVFGIPVPLLIFAVVVVAVSLLLNRTTYGFKVYLLGTNPTASRFSGIDNAAITIRTHMLVGLLSAVTGIVTLARTNSANADYGSSYILTTILIAVLGGIAVTGGFGRLLGVVLALVALQMLSTGFNMLLLGYSGSNFFRDLAWGVLLLLVMATGRVSRQRLSRVFGRRGRFPGEPPQILGSRGTKRVA